MNFRNDVDDIQGCEKYRFAFGKDEMMMNAEAGLYFKFDQENGIPTNCEGLEDFNMDHWLRANGSRSFLSQQKNISYRFIQL